MKQQIVLENERMRLVLGADARPISLICKETQEECLQADQEISMFSVTQERPYNNEVKLAHPNKRTTFQANRVRQEGNHLIVGFELTPFEAVVEVRVQPSYIGFTLESFIVHPDDYPDLCMAKPPVAEFRILQLPVKNRENFGEWLNVSWDERAAVNVLSTSQYARIDSEKRKGYRLMTADAVKGIKLLGTGAALIADTPDRLLDDIGNIEEDYALPKGVQSRRDPRINRSALWTSDITPDNVDEYIRYAKMGGFRLMLIYYFAFFKTGRGYTTCGNYDDCDFNDAYPNGLEDVRRMLERIKEAGITPGLHFLQTHIGTESRYVTPVVDHRLHKTRRFTLSRPLGTDDTVLYVEEDPSETVLADHCRVLQFGGEAISYESYTTEPPYCFTGCERGHYRTNITVHPMGEVGGVLDVSEFGNGTSIYLDQESSLQDEIADKLSRLYGAGFEYAYFDGSEGTNPPFEYHVPGAQYRVYKKLNPAPILAEGAAKAHFSWHMLSGGNAFDIFKPEVFKEKLAMHPAEEAPRMQKDFTRLNFGWWAFWAPALQSGKPQQSVCGTQADMFEYGTSRAAAWDCPITLQANKTAFEQHPRTDDIMEVMRRWEAVRESGWLTREQKDMLKNLRQEHILLLDENGSFELQPYDRVECSDERLIAYIFERKNSVYAVYWHRESDGELSLPIADITVTDELGQTPLPIRYENGQTVVPVGKRRYIRWEGKRETLEKAFQKANILA